jgi:hypothetical protein
VREALRKNPDVVALYGQKQLNDRILSTCVLPTEVLIGERAQMHAWMARAAAEVEAEIKKDAKRIKAEVDDEIRAGADYYLCLQRSAKMLALNSDESADTIAQAAFPACTAERNGVFNTYRRYNDLFEPSAMQAMEGVFSKRLLLDVLVTRAQRRAPAPPTSQPAPQKTPI